MNEVISYLRPRLVRDVLGEEREFGDEPVPIGSVLAGEGGAVMCVRESMSVAVLSPLFAERELSSVLVVDAYGRLRGGLSERQLRIAAVAAPDARAGDVAHGVTSVTDDTSIRHALLKMARHNLRFVPIVNAGGTLLGVLRDVVGLRWLAPEGRGA
jgi:CBS domain-containing protein